MSIEELGVVSVGLVVLALTLMALAIAQQVEQDSDSQDTSLRMIDERRVSATRGEVGGQA